MNFDPPPNSNKPPLLHAPASWTHLPGWVQAYLLASRTDLARARDTTTADVYDALCTLWRIPLAFAAPAAQPRPPTVYILSPALAPTVRHLGAAAGELVEVVEFLAANAGAEPRRVPTDAGPPPRLSLHDWLVLVCPAPAGAPEPETVSHLRRLAPHRRCCVAVFGDCTRMPEDPREAPRRPGARTDESGAETSEAEVRRAAAEARSREKRLADAGLRKAPGRGTGPKAPPRTVAVQRLRMAEIWSYGAFVTVTSQAAGRGLDGLERLMDLLQARTYDALVADPDTGPRRLVGWLSSHTYRTLHPHAVLASRLPSIPLTRAFNLVHSPDGPLPVLSRRSLEEGARKLSSCLANEDILSSLTIPIDQTLKIIHSQTYKTHQEANNEIGSISEIAHRLLGLLWKFSGTIIIVSEAEMRSLDPTPQCQFMTFDTFFKTIESDF